MKGEYNNRIKDEDKKSFIHNSTILIHFKIQ